MRLPGSFPLPAVAHKCLVASAFRLRARRFGGPPEPWRRLVRRKGNLALPFVVVVWLLFALVPAAQTKPSRIISLIPAVTEMLFAIGAGPQVIAVGTFDEYPPEVKQLEKVGALLDPNVERILALRPDLVVVYGSQDDLQRQLQRANIATFVYRHAGLAGITETMHALGERVGRSREASETVRRIESQMQQIRTRAAAGSRPATLVVFGHEPGALRGIYASGGFGFVNDMLEAAGGRNVFADIKRESVQATAELILARKPEMILELRANALSDAERGREIAAWKTLPSVPAVRSGRVIFITDPRVVIPGPRVAEGTELIARAIRPEAFR
jgi:iron complex transport system substrate-binding protein